MELDQIAAELKAQTSEILKTKDTCILYKFKSNVEKCIKEKSIRNKDTIIECIEQLNGLIPSKLVENLFKKCLEIEETELCLKLIKNVQILEENQAVDCLKYFLKNFTIESQLDERLINQLDTVLSKSYDYRILTTELKKLASNEFIACLKYLQNYLKNSFQQQDVDVHTTDDNLSQIRPNILQSIELFSCLIDAHFTHVTLLPVAQEIVVDVLTLVENQLDLFGDLISVESLIKEIKQNNGFQIKNSNTMGHYFIEVLKLT